MWWKPIAGTLKMCLFSHCDAFTMKQCQTQNCFLPKWSGTGAANCAVQRYKNGKVDMKGVFSVSVVHWNVDSDIVTTGASLDKALAERTTTSGRVRLHFPSPNKQTISNSCSNGMQWKSVENLLFMGLICSRRIWILPACHIGLPEGAGVLSGVLTFLTVHELPIKDIPNIPARSTNALH